MSFRNGSKLKAAEIVTVGFLAAVLVLTGCSKSSSYNSAEQARQKLLAEGLPCPPSSSGGRIKGNDGVVVDKIYCEIVKGSSANYHVLVLPGGESMADWIKTQCAGQMPFDYNPEPGHVQGSNWVAVGNWSAIPVSQNEVARALGGTVLAGDICTS